MRLRPLSEAEAYARCYGDGDDSVRFVKLEPKRPRYATKLSGEDLRQAFESRLDKREPTEPAAGAGADSVGAPSPSSTAPSLPRPPEVAALL